MRRSFLALGAAALVAALYFFLIAPLSEKKAEMREEIEVKGETLRKYEKFISGADVTDKEFKGEQETLDELEEGVIKHTELPLAFAELQMALQDMAEGAGIDVTSIRPLEPVSYEGYTGLPILMEGRSEIRQLGLFLRALDKEGGFIRVDKLSVRVSADKREKALMLKMQLMGLMKA